MRRNFIFQGDALDVLKLLPDECVHCVVTSPPYWGLRDYGVKGQLGSEDTFAEYLVKMTVIFEEVRRVLKNSGTLWLNMGDSYANRGGQTPMHGELFKGRRRAKENICKSNRSAGGIDGFKNKDLIGQPWRVAFALQAAGWYLRSDIIWNKPNPMPESVTDRPTKSHEYIFLLTKGEKYFYDQDAIAEGVSPNTHARVSQELGKQIGSSRANGNTRTNRPMKAVLSPKAMLALKGTKNNASFERACCVRVAQRNKRSVWTVNVQGYKGAHFATFPTKLIEPCIKAGCPVGGIVYDPFMGSGTTALVAAKLGRDWLGSELNEKYIALAMERLGLFGCMQEVG